MSEKCTRKMPGFTSRNLGQTERPVSGGEVVEPSSVLRNGLPPTPVVSPLVRAFHTYFVTGESKEEPRAI